MTNFISQTCCFTGHRDIPAADRDSLYQVVKEQIVSLINQGYRYFGAGGALGFDMLAEKAVLELRDQFHQIRLILVLTCIEQTRGWSSADKAEYDRILHLADKVVYTSRDYYSGCMHKRNRHLVDNSSACICYLKQNQGGTAYTVSYARQKCLRIINCASKLPR